MRLSRSVEVLFGVAVSGGVALLLGGSAFAADNTAGANAPASTVPNTAQVGPTSAKVAPGSTSDQSVSANTSNKNVVVNNNSTVIAVPSGGAGVAPANTQSSAPASPQTSTNPPGVNTADSTTVSGAQQSAGTVKSPTIADGASPVAATTSVPGASAAQTGSAAPNTSVASVALPTKDVLFKSVALPIQPKITEFHPVGEDDLATTIPSAPSQQQNPTKVPAPSQPGGLFTQLTTQLAGSVVPQVFTPPISGFVSLVARLTIVLSSLLLLTGIIGLTFGARLRQSGYAHAARSDMASAFLSLFATPFNLSYVTAYPPKHSSFLIVSETKIVRLTAPSVIRKEETK